jgi:hypothetical protein
LLLVLAHGNAIHSGLYYRCARKLMRAIQGKQFAIKHVESKLGGDILVVHISCKLCSSASSRNLPRHLFTLQHRTLILLLVASSTYYASFSSLHVWGFVHVALLLEYHNRFSHAERDVPHIAKLSCSKAQCVPHLTHPRPRSVVYQSRESKHQSEWSCVHILTSTLCRIFVC